MKLLHLLADTFLDVLEIIWPFDTPASAGPPAAEDDPAGSTPLPAGSPAPSEGVESRPLAIPPSEVAPEVYLLPTSALLSRSADALTGIEVALGLLLGISMEGDEHQLTLWCDGLRDRAAQLAAHGD